jgi:hypothetical protein
MKNNMFMKQMLFLGLVLFCTVQSSLACPQGSIYKLLLPGNEYQLNVNLDFDSSTYTEFVNITWSFGDASPDVTVVSHAVTHTFLPESVYSISAVVRYKNQYNDTCSTSLNYSLNTSNYPCPKAVFTPEKYLNWCHTGTVELLWSYCNEDRDNQNGPDDYWTPVNADWFINGVYQNSTSNTQSWYWTFESANEVIISANVTFVNIDGEYCSNVLYYSLDEIGNHDPCDIALGQPVEYYSSFLLEPKIAIPNLSVESLVVCVGDTVELVDHSTVIPSNYQSGFTHDLLLDGNLVLSQNDLPTSGQTFYQTSFSESGQYVFELTYSFEHGCPRSSSIVVEVIDCVEDCDNCNTFKPVPGDKYWISAWVNENQSSQVKSFANSSIEVEFKNGSTTIGTQVFYTTGDIIDGWQRIVGSFVIPSATSEIKLHLKNSNTSILSYFDDVRVHPFNSSMKSYVYDPVTLWLTAELDDNNYATFYEYDKEGQLIRIKKETSRGIMTIQESRMSNPKSE